MRIPSKFTRKTTISTTARASPGSRENQSSKGTIEVVETMAEIEIRSVGEIDLNIRHVTGIGNVTIAAKIISLAIRSVSDARRPHLQAPEGNNHSLPVKVTGRVTIVATITLPGEASVTSVRNQDQAEFQKVVVANRSEVDEAGTAEEIVGAAAEASIGEVAVVASIRALNPIPAEDQQIKKLNSIKLQFILFDL